MVGVNVMVGEGSGVKVTLGVIRGVSLGRGVKVGGKVGLKSRVGIGVGAAMRDVGVLQAANAKTTNKQNTAQSQREGQKGRGPCLA